MKLYNIYSWLQEYWRLLSYDYAAGLVSLIETSELEYFMEDTGLESVTDAAELEKTYMEHADS